MNLKEYLKNTVFFSNQHNPAFSQFSHLIIGGILFWFFGIKATIIPIIKELLDIWIYKGISKKTLIDLSFWYLGMVTVFLIQK